MNKFAMLAASLTAVAAASGPAQAAVVKVDQGVFQGTAGLINFSEKSAGTLDPVYAPGQYTNGGQVGATVSFGGLFAGQTFGTAALGSCAPGPGGSIPAVCANGSPTAPLTLLPQSGTDPNGLPVTLTLGTFIGTDSARGGASVISGGSGQLGNLGSIAVLFSTAMEAVGFDGGFFNNAGLTELIAFDASGSVLGSLTNTVAGGTGTTPTGVGVEFLGLGSNDGSAQIRGIIVRMIGDEQAGFSMDNLRFGFGAQVVVSPPTGVPEPGSAALVGLALAGLGLLGRRRRG